MGNLDILVATQVMGWKRAGEDDMVSPHHRPIYPPRPDLGYPVEDQEPVAYLDNWDSKGPHPRLVPPDYDFHHDNAFYLCSCRGTRGIDRLPYWSSSVEEALDIAEHMAAKHGAQMDISRGLVTPYFEVIFTPNEGHAGFGVGDDLAVAICLAAIAMVQDEW